MEERGEEVAQAKERANERGDKVPGNCHRCSAIFITGQGQSFLKALQIAYPLRSIHREALDGGGGRGGAINFHYFIVNASLISATSETRRGGRRGREERHETEETMRAKRKRKLKREVRRGAKTLGTRYTRARARSVGSAPRRCSFRTPLIALSAALL